MMNKFTYKKVDIKNDFNIIKKKFLKNFKKNISKKFYIWRYIDNNQFYCYVVKKNKSIIGHVGFVKYKQYDGNFFASRHSSFIDQKYRRKNLYTKLVKFSLKELDKKKFLFLLIWPNANNTYTNKKFNNLIKLPIIKTYISQHHKKNQIYLKKLKDIKQLKSFINLKDNFHLIKKDLTYFFWRYIDKKPKEVFYLRSLKNRKSLLIFNYNKKDKIYNLLEHIGSKDDYIYHIREINNKLRFIFWVNSIFEKKRIFKELKVKKYKNNKFYSYIIPVRKDFNLKNKKLINFFMGDTDVFIQSF